MAELSMPAHLSPEPDDALRDLEDVQRGDFTEEGSWRVRDLGGAEWCMRRLSRLQAKIAKIEQQYQVWAAEVGGWRADELRPLERDVAYFEGRLIEWAVRERANDPSRATFHLPSGVVETTLHRQPTVTITDRKAVLLWAEQSLDAATQEEVVKHEKSILVSKLRDVVEIAEAEDGSYVPVTANGELVPGVAIRPPHVTATVKAAF